MKRYLNESLSASSVTTSSGGNLDHSRHVLVMDSSNVDLTKHFNKLSITTKVVYQEQYFLSFIDQLKFFRHSALFYDYIATDLRGYYSNTGGTNPIYTIYANCKSTSSMSAFPTDNSSNTLADALGTSKGVKFSSSSISQNNISITSGSVDTITFDLINAINGGCWTSTDVLVIEYTPTLTSIIWSYD